MTPTLARAFALAVLSMPVTAYAVEPTAVVRWNDDLSFLAAELPKTHPDPFHATSRDAFLGAIDSLRGRLPRLAGHEIAVEIGRIAASLGEGHTRLTLPLDPSHGFFAGHSRTDPPRDSSLAFHACAIRLHLLADGVFVRRIDARHGRLAGARVVGIGDRTIDQAIAAVMPVVHRDNDSQGRETVAAYLVVPEVLHARGVIPARGRVTYVLEPAPGRQETVTLEPLAASTGVAWTDARRGAPPLSARRHDEPFWFEHLPEQRAVYFQYNQVSDRTDETLEAFAARLFQQVRERGVRRLVIDLRDNFGGDGSLNRPLVHGILRTPALVEPGGLVVLIGRRTFSAAMMFAIDLEQQTPVIFVGEESGGKPNSHGDSRRLVLPNSGLTVRVSTLYWQSSDPRDRRPAIVPHVTVTESSADHAAGRDRALETALGFEGGSAEAPALAGRWTGTVTVGFQRAPVALVLSRDSGAWSGTIDSAPVGLANVKLTDVTVDGARLRATAPFGESTLAIEASLGTKRLAGWVLPRGRRYLLVAERAS
jgi:hypothetical protein